jgi:class 3 adenylate cyclase/tetratricopeptide (TPR) repeat protein
MRCSRCGAENPTGMRFCGQCAAPLGVACPSCGATSPPESRFCGGCGAPLPGAAARSATNGALPGEIKQVTVLFCDIVNSTALTERLGAEAMRDLVGAFIDTALAEIHRYGGTAPQFSGDGFMALFGAPVTQEDHVRRALLSALAIRDALKGESKQGSTGRPEVQIRIGIHTGPVVFGAIGGGFRVDTAIGDTANVAARLQQATEPGTILISEAVRALTQGYARVEPVGPLQLKGKPDPIAGYRLLGVSRWRSARDAATPARVTAFVGRELELAQLKRFLEQVESGRGQVVAVTGEPGIGKSRLLVECRRRIEGEGMTWVEGHCLSYGAAIPYQLVLDVLRSNCGITETDTAEAIAQKVRSGLLAVGMDAKRDGSVLLHLLGVRNDGAAAAPSNPEAFKARSFEVLHRFCLEGSRRRPLVLVLEDVHWIDTISEEFCGHLARQIVDARILLLATYRPEYRPPWAELSNAREILLRPLSRDDGLHVVRSVLREEQLAGPLADEIVVKADGNPLFLEQLALHAGEAEQHSDLAVPHTIHGVVMARIDRLPEAAKELLQLAAVIGREFSLRLLRAVWNRHGPLEAALRELSRLEFLDEWPDDEGTTYVFRHALTQETAYRSLLARQRRFHHRAVGDALEALYPGRTEEVAELLALHFGRSDEAEKAVDYLITAAEKSQRRWANRDALSYFDDALRRLVGMPDNQENRLRRIDGVVKQAELKLALGRHAEQMEALERIRGIIDETGDPPRRAAWHYWTGFLQILTGGQASVAIGHCRKAAEIAAAAEFHELDGTIASCLAQAYVVAGELRAAIDMGERALSIFEASGNLWWASRALWHLSSAANCLGEWDRSLAYCRRALELGTLLGDLRLKVGALLRTGSTYVQLGDTDRGLRYCSDALAHTSIPFDTAAARTVRGYALVKAGQVDAGIAELNDVVTWFHRARLSHLRLLATLWLAESYLLRDDFSRARPLAEEAVHSTHTSGYLHFEGIAHRLMGECLIAEDQSAADEHLGIALAILDRIGARNDYAKTLVAQAKLRWVNGDITTARMLLTEGLTIFEALGTRDDPAKVKATLDRLSLNMPGSRAATRRTPTDEIIPQTPS